MPWTSPGCLGRSTWSSRTSDYSIAGALLGFIPALETAARWLDQSRTLLPMLEHMLSATEWARVGTSLALWMALPLLVGLWRIMRSDVR